MDDKVKFEIEFPIQASPQLLFQYISTPSGLSEWFADDVNSRGEIFTFIWDDSEEDANVYADRILYDVCKDGSIIIRGDYKIKDIVPAKKLIYI
mgnify:CR=1 FL=1